MAATPSNNAQRYRIGDLVLDSGLRRVSRGEETLSMGGLTFDFLLTLAAGAPNLVTYDDFAERVWNGRPTTPETITQRAKMLREALDDDAADPKYVELIRGQGYRLIPNVTALDTKESDLPKQSARAIWAGIAALVAVAVFAGYWLDSPAIDKSVAVLPFADMSPGGDQRYLADGIAEELINELSNLDELHVVSRTSSFSFRDSEQDLESIAEQLGVAAILEGSVRKFEDEIRVSVQFTDARSGETLWTDSFDGEVSEIFVVQEQIAQQTAGALGVTLGVDDGNAFKGAGTSNFEAYEAYLQGSYQLALELDPNYAAAWARRGVQIASTMWRNRPEAAPDILDRAYPYVARAVELDPESSNAHGRYATFVYARMNWIESEESFRRSLALRQDRDILVGYANMLMRTGRLQRSQRVQLDADAVERLPRSEGRLRNIGRIAAGQFDAARDAATRLREIRRVEANALIALNDGSIDDVRAALVEAAAAYSELADLYNAILPVLDSPTEALAILRTQLDDTDNVWPSKYHDIALLAAYFGDAELALEAYGREMPYTTVRFSLLWYPIMAEARRLPEFKRLVTEVGLPDYWRTYGWADACHPVGDDDFECR